MVAMALLITMVLPSEFGITPTGEGIELKLPMEEGAVVNYRLNVVGGKTTLYHPSYTPTAIKSRGHIVCKIIGSGTY